MEGLNFENVSKFKTPQEELDFLRAHIAQREKEIGEQGKEANKENLAHEVISEYKKYKPEDVMQKKAIVAEREIENLVLRLHPETHDGKMEELLGILLSKGISNALSVVSKMNNPHIDDDFHRFLVQYLYSVHQIPGLKEKTPLFKTLDMKLFEISLPDIGGSEENKKSLKELLNMMEQFYAGMHSVGEDRDNSEQDHFSLEIALSEDSDNFVVYAAVPSRKADLFEKQLFGVHASAKMVEEPDDYNIFSENGSFAGSYATLTNQDVFPIKLYDTLDHDPLNIILNIFTKMKKTGEGASIQFTICPEGDGAIKRFNSILEEVKSGVSVSDATASFSKQLGNEAKSLIKGFFSSGKEEKDDVKKEKDKKIDEKAVEYISEKVKSTIMATTIRIIVSAEDEARAQQILSEMESSFNQFTEAGRNGFIFTRPKKVDLMKLIHDFSYRIF